MLAESWQLVADRGRTQFFELRKENMRGRAAILSGADSRSLIFRYRHNDTQENRPSGYTENRAGAAQAENALDHVCVGWFVVFRLVRL